MGDGIVGKITDFLREFVVLFSSILTIFGVVLLFIGAGGLFFRESIKSILSLSNALLDWSLYILIIGFIVFAFGFYYLYVYFKNKKFILEELETNKRSELKKRHLELKRTVKHMPTKYKEMLKQKEKELNLK